MVNIRELEAHLDEYVKRATHGESVVIVDGGKPVAELVPPHTPFTDHLLELARQGRVVLPTRPRFIPDLTGATMGPGQSLTDILLEERRDDRLLR